MSVDAIVVSGEASQNLVVLPLRKQNKGRWRLSSIWKVDPVTSVTPPNQLFLKVWHENPRVVSCLQYIRNKVHLFVLLELRFEGINHSLKLPWQH